MEIQMYREPCKKVSQRSTTLIVKMPSPFARIDAVEQAYCLLRSNTPAQVLACSVLGELQRYLNVELISSLKEVQFPNKAPTY